MAQPSLNKDATSAEKLKVIFDLRYTDGCRFSDLSVMVSENIAWVESAYREELQRLFHSKEFPRKKPCVCLLLNGKKCYLCEQCRDRMSDYYSKWAVRMRQALSVVDGMNRQIIGDT